jgi:hypothetical protein
VRVKLCQSIRERQSDLAVAGGGCRSYLIGCEKTCAALLDTRTQSAAFAARSVGTTRQPGMATATLRQMGFRDAVALDGGVKVWREAGYPVTSGKELSAALAPRAYSPDHAKEAD